MNVSVRIGNSSNNVNITNAVLKATVTQNRCLNFCHFNSQSLHTKRFSKIDEIRHIFKGTNFHLIGVTETWLKPSISDKLVELNNFKIFRNDRIKSRSGGVAVYIKNGIKAFIVAKSIDKSNLTHNQINQLDRSVYPTEGIEFIFVEVHANNQKLLFGVVYNPKGIKYSNRLNLCPIFDDCINKYDDVIIVGDFNTNLLDIKPYVVDFKDLINEYGLVNASFHPTHFTNTSATLLDLVLVNHAAKILFFNQVDVPGISKHDLIFASYDIEMQATEPSKIIFRNFRAANVNQIYNEILSLPWSWYYSLADSELLLSFLNENLLAIFERCVPLKTIIINDKDPPWLTDRIKSVMMLRNSSYKSWIRYRDPIFFQQYKHHRNKVNGMIKASKQSYMNNYLGTNLSSKELWKRIKGLGIKSTSTGSVPFSPDSLLDSFTANTNIASISSSSNIRESIDEERNFLFENVDTEIVFKSVMSIKSNATGLDGVPMKFIKLILPIIAPHITHLFNYILTSSSFPNSWKHGKIIPVPKISNPKSPKDIRPITILPALSKALEKIISDQINRHLNEFELLSSFQSGFRKRFSTETALLKVSDDIICSLDDRDVAILVLLDFSKAFDMVNYDILLEKLSVNFNFSRSALKLISSYLQDRSQLVQINDLRSTVSLSRCGVPQGSILGPLLFCLYINDLPNVIKSSKVHMYADDVQIYNSGPSRKINELVNNINTDIRNILDWSNRNSLRLNVDKTQVIMFSLSNNENIRNTIPCISIGTQTIEYSVSVRNLGIVMDECFNWNCQINNICKKIYGCLRQLWSTSSFTPFLLRKKLFNSLILPHFYYCGSVLGSISAGGIQKLRKALNCCARYVYGIGRYESISSYSKELLGFELRMFYSYLCCKQIHKILTFKSPNYLLSKFTLGSSRRTQQLIVPRNSTEVKNKSFCVYGVKQYNNLTTSLKSKSFNSFKIGCKDFFRSF